MRHEGKDVTGSLAGSATRQDIVIGILFVQVVLLETQREQKQSISFIVTSPETKACKDETLLVHPLYLPLANLWLPASQHFASLLHFRTQFSWQ